MMMINVTRYTKFDAEPEFECYYTVCDADEDPEDITQEYWKRYPPGGYTTIVRRIPIHDGKTFMIMKRWVGYDVAN